MRAENKKLLNSEVQFKRTCLRSQACEDIFRIKFQSYCVCYFCTSLFNCSFIYPNTLPVSKLRKTYFFLRMTLPAASSGVS
jgi:hypothetical protein